MLSRRSAMLKWILSLGVVILLILLYMWNRSADNSPYELQGDEGPLLTFVIQYMMGSSGEIYTNLRDDLPLLENMASNHHVLSESVGLMMHYALKTDREELFETQYDFLRNFLITKNYNIRWVYDSQGHFNNVHVNASIDDLKIIQALLEASSQWKREEYERLAEQLSEQLLSSVKEDFLVDYYDWEYKISAEHITASYLDIASLHTLSERNPKWLQVYEKSKQLLIDAQLPNGLFYKTYDLKSGIWQSADRYNMIDVLYAAIHLSESGHGAQDTLQFIEQKWLEDGQLYSSYDQNGNPVDLFHSPAVYALAYRLFKEEDSSSSVSDEIYNSMKELSVQNEQSPYFGGYVELSTLDAHSFDQLQALLAESHRGLNQ